MLLVDAHFLWPQKDSLHAYNQNLVFGLRAAAAAAQTKNNTFGCTGIIFEPHFVEEAGELDHCFSDPIFFFDFRVGRLLILGFFLFSVLIFPILYFLIL